MREAGDDRQLVRRCLKGDERAFSQLVTRYEGALYRLAFNYRADYEADDAFLISNGETEFLVSGQVADLEFLSKEQQAVLVEDEDGAEEAADDLMDFSMF